eukprot:gene24693-10325_t
MPRPGPAFIVQPINRAPAVFIVCKQKPSKQQPGKRKPAEKAKRFYHQQQQRSPDDPTYWYSHPHLPTATHVEWFIDCHRMFEDDMDELKIRNYKSGLYVKVEDLTGMPLTWAFLLCKALPKTWDWGACLRKADALLPYALAKQDAREKYDGENVFSQRLGLQPSLRWTASLIHGFLTVDGDTNSLQCTEVAKSMTDCVAQQVGGWENADPRHLMSQFDPGFFADVGGSEAWIALEDSLDTQLAKLIRDGHHRDEFGIFGLWWIKHRMSL